MCNGRLSLSSLSRPLDIDFKVTWVGSADSEEYDQVLDSVLVGPVPVGYNKITLTVGRGLVCWRFFAFIEISERPLAPRGLGAGFICVTGCRALPQHCTGPHPAARSPALAPTTHLVSTSLILSRWVSANTSVLFPPPPPSLPPLLTTNISSLALTPPLLLHSLLTTHRRRRRIPHSSRPRSSWVSQSSCLLARTRRTSSFASATMSTATCPRTRSCKRGLAKRAPPTLVSIQTNHSSLTLNPPPPLVATLTACTRGRSTRTSSSAASSTASRA